MITKANYILSKDYDLLLLLNVLLFHFKNHDKHFREKCLLKYINK